VQVDKVAQRDMQAGQEAAGPIKAQEEQLRLVKETQAAQGILQWVQRKCIKEVAVVAPAALV
jgi:hypothetical protein